MKISAPEVFKFKRNPGRHIPFAASGVEHTNAGRSFRAISLRAMSYGGIAPAARSGFCMKAP